MGIVLLVLLVGLPVLLLAFSLLWDRRHRRLTGTVPTVTRRRRSFADTVVNTSLEGMAVESKRRSANRGKNYGDLGPR